jgi:hypothetical protein
MAMKMFCDVCKESSFDVDGMYGHFHGGLPLGWAKVERSIKAPALQRTDPVDFAPFRKARVIADGVRHELEIEPRRATPEETALFEQRAKELENLGYPSQPIFLCGRCAESHLQGLEFKNNPHGIHGLHAGIPVPVA